MTDPDLELAEKLLLWSQQRGSYVALVDIYQRGLNTISDAATARKLAKILEAHGWFVPVPGDNKAAVDRLDGAGKYNYPQPIRNQPC